MLIAFYDIKGTSSNRFFTPIPKNPKTPHLLPEMTNENAANPDF